MTVWLHCCSKKFKAEKAYRDDDPETGTAKQYYTERCPVCLSPAISYRNIGLYGERSEVFKAYGELKADYCLKITSGQAIPIAKPGDDRETRGRMVAGDYTHKAARPVDQSLSYIMTTLCAELGSGEERNWQPMSRAVLARNWDKVVPW